MYKDIQITCQAFNWDTGELITDCNFFSGVAPNSTGQIIDLTPFILDTGSVRLKREFDKALNDSAGQRTMFNIAPDLELSLCDWKLMNDGMRLKDYFRLYNTSTTYDRLKFLFKFYYAGSLRFQGCLNRETVEQAFTGMSDDRVIKIRVIGWEKEFKEYFSSVGLVGTDELIFSHTSTSGNNYLTLLECLEGNFDGVDINIPEESVRDWCVIESAEFYQSATLQPLHWNFCGYWNVWQSKENRFDWLRRMCNSMGWIFFFNPSGSSMELIIKNRSTHDSVINILQLDARKKISTHASTIKANPTFENIVVIYGWFDGGSNAFPYGADSTNNHRGERVAIISDTAFINNDPLHFSVVTVFSGSYTLSHVLGDSFSKYYNESDTDWSYAVFTFTGATLNYFTAYNLNKQSTLFLDTGFNGEVRQRVQLTDGGQAPHRMGDPYDEYDLLYAGNYGTMLFQVQSPIPFLLFYYHDYVQGTAFGNVEANQFQKNHRKFLRKRNSNLTLRHVEQGFYSDPLNIIQFLNVASDEDYYSASDSNKWSIVEIESDAINDRTTFNLSGQ